MRTLFGPRLGAGFTRLWAASAVSNLGDGVTMVAGPLLLASVTADPALVAGGVFAQQLPWLLFALISGAWADRFDRLRLIVTVDLVRALAMGGLALAVATGQATVPLIYLALFVLGLGETVADTAAGALLPSVVGPEHLERANARFGATFTVANQFAAKPLGAWLFGIAAAVPFGLDALTFVAAAVLVASLRPAVGPATPDPAGPAASLRADIAEGLRWLRGHRLLRSLAVAMGLGNVAFGAAFAVFVLYARDRLGLTELGYGVLLTTFAVGGLTGAGVATRLARRFGSAAVLRAGLLVESLTHLVLAVTRSPWLAGAVLVVFGVHTMVWGVITSALRQRLVPGRLLGRVGSVCSLLELGGAAVGSLIGGLLARTWTVTTPFWLAAAATAAIAVAAWRPLALAAPGSRT